MCISRIARLVLVLTAVSPWALRAQCDPYWHTGHGLLGTDGQVLDSCVWDPDGGGPQFDQLVIVGTFHKVGTAVASYAAYYDFQGGQWHGFAVDPPEPLMQVVGGPLGLFGSSATAVYNWTGSSWDPLPMIDPNSGPASGIPLAMGPNGDLIVSVGLLPPAGGGVWSWDGVLWVEVGNCPWQMVDFAIDGASLYATNGIDVFQLSASSYTTIASVPWVGITDIEVFNGEVVLGGVLVLDPLNPIPIAAAHVVAGVVEPLGYVGVGAANDLLVTSTGSLYMFGGIDGDIGMFRWNGVAWSKCGSQVPDGRAMSELAGGDVFAAAFPMRLARWDSALTDWFAMTDGFAFDGGIKCLAQDAAGDILMGGSNISVPGHPEPVGIARFDGLAWHAVGTGCPIESVEAVAVDSQGGIYVGGTDVSSQGVAYFDGVGWTNLGAGLNGDARAIAVHPDGSIIVGGAFLSSGATLLRNIARWNPSTNTWSALGAGFNSAVQGLDITEDGDIIAVGLFTSSGSTSIQHVARWNGSAWSGIDGGANGPVYRVAAANDRIFILGGFSNAGGVAASRYACWDTSGWHAIAGNASLPSNALAKLPDGTVVAGGGFYFPGLGYYRLARWDEGAWKPIPGAVADNFIPLDETVLSCALFDQNNELVVGGNQFEIGGVVSAGFARLAIPCAAQAEEYGAGCANSWGKPQLHATALPWVGEVFRSRVTGLTPLGITVFGYGLTQAAVPLDNVLAEALPGCWALMVPDINVGASATTFDLDLAVALPNDPAFVGFTFYHQVAQLADWLPDGLTWTSSNALRLVVGIGL